ncbi:MAG: FAD-dependent oxidoreductase [Mycobacteriales bacterium]
MAERYDVAVVGGGPAGMAAAATAARAGGRVALVDGAPRPGGQYWRHRPGHEPGGTYTSLHAALDPVHHHADSPVWFVEPGFTLHTPGREIAADRLVLATGAHDRPLPFPGWDLPGVMTPGGAQALLKGQGVVPGRRIVVAGAGPFLLAVAAHLAAAGVEVAGVYEAASRAALLRYATVPAPGKATEAARYAAVLGRRRVPYRPGHAVTAAHGDRAVEAVTVSRLADGRTRQITCDTVAVAYGFTPRLELATALGCATHLAADGTLVVTTDPAQRTTVPGVYAAGEITGIGGSALALVEGQLAGHAATGTPPPTRLLRRRTALRRFAAAMNAIHAPPAGWPDWLTPTTPICRCESVPYGRLAEAVTDLGATTARTVKLLARPGMGLCQGRICGYPTACLTAHLTGRTTTDDDLAAFAERPLAQPVPLGELSETRSHVP